MIPPRIIFSGFRFPCRPFFKWFKSSSPHTTSISTSSSKANRERTNNRDVVLYPSHSTTLTLTLTLTPTPSLTLTPTPSLTPTPTPTPSQLDTNKKAFTTTAASPMRKSVFFPTTLAKSSTFTTSRSMTTISNPSQTQILHPNPFVTPNSRNAFANANTANTDQEQAQLLEHVNEDLNKILNNILALTTTDHPTLQKVAAYCFQKRGKSFRPRIVSLISRALNYHQSITTIPTTTTTTTTTATPIPIPTPHNDNNVIHWCSRFSHDCKDGIFGQVLDVQLQLAEIVEMIHTASLIHDDIIDQAETRRGVPSLHQAFTSKMAVLAGDFLLARASQSLARLRNHDVTDLMASSIANLVEGEFMQLDHEHERHRMNNTSNNGYNNNSFNWQEMVGMNEPDSKHFFYNNYQDKELSAFDLYLKKTYLKTASLITKACRSAALLANLPPQLVHSATEYGENLGIAFQLIDDVLDFIGSTEKMGKATGSDLAAGLATAPVLYAQEDFPDHLTPLIDRRFSLPGDAHLVRQFVAQSKGVEKARHLAKQYSDRAMQALSFLVPSPAKSALIRIAEEVLTRNH